MVVSVKERRSRSQMFFKIGVLKKVSRENICLGVFF